MKFPLIVESKLYEMDAISRRAFMEEYNRRRKSVFTGYVLLMLFGWHYAYVNKWSSQLLCWLTLWGLLLWWIIDWFRLPFIIKRYNNDLSVKIITEISLIYGNSTQHVSATPKNEVSNWLKQNPGKSLNDYYRK